jgi:hypothetical protein
MTVSLWIRETVGGKRTYRKLNKKKIYLDDTVFCLRYTVDGKRRWKTLHVTNLNAALAARASEEAALLTDVSATSKAAAKRINVDDTITVYLNNVAATRAHRTWLAYTLMLNGFRKSCSKQYLDQIDKSDLTAFVVALKKEGEDDRTVTNRVAGDSANILRCHRPEAILNILVPTGTVSSSSGCCSHEKKGEAEASSLIIRVQRSLENLHVICLKALRPFGHVELHSLPLLQAPKTVAADSREMHENVFASLAANKAEALGIVKPFHCSLFHCLFLFFVEFSAEKNRCY